MPMLTWNETDFIECLETLPDKGDYEEYSHWCIEKHGLRLGVIVNSCGCGGLDFRRLLG